MLNRVNGRLVDVGEAREGDGDKYEAAAEAYRDAAHVMSRGRIFEAFQGMPAKGALDKVSATELHIVWAFGK